MRKIQQLRQDFVRILGNFESVLAIPEGERTTRDRDSAILRFELTYEVCWKLLQAMVRDEGFESNGPRQAFARAYTISHRFWFPTAVASPQRTTSRPSARNVTSQKETADPTAAPWGHGRQRKAA